MKKDSLQNVRIYGKEPYRAAVIHGGPGAPGTMAPVARRLSEKFGVLEPLQHRSSIAGLLEELDEQLEAFLSGPAVLIGHSWGAWLAVFFAGYRPGKVKSLVLVGSGPFEDSYVPEIGRRRMAALTASERLLFAELEAGLAREPKISRGNGMLRRLGELAEKADNVDPVCTDPDKNGALPVDEALYRSLWNEASALRRSGLLAGALEKIRCPLHVIHGDRDPHPAAGVTEPLEMRKVPFTLHMFENCGHNPFYERAAVSEFYRILGKIALEGEK